MEKYYFEAPGILSVDILPRFDPEKGSLAFWLGKIPTPIYCIMLSFGFAAVAYLAVCGISARVGFWVAVVVGFVTFLVVLGSRLPGVTTIVFNYDEGIVTEVNDSGKRVDHGVFAEIDRIVLRETKEIFSVNRSYVIVWKDRFKPVLCVSPFVYKPERLELFRDEIAPRLDVILSEYRSTHPEEKPQERNPPIARDTPLGGYREEFFIFDGGSFYRCIWVEIIMMCVVCLGLGAWLALARYGVAGTTILSTLFLGSLVLWYYLDKVLVISQRNRTLAVLSGFGMRAEEFDFERVRRLAITRMLGLLVVTMVLAGGQGITLDMTFDKEKAKRIAEEAGRLIGVDPYDILTFE